MNVKIIFPAGYSVSDFYNDNIDINIVFRDGRVFFATAFTLENIDYLMTKDSDIYFWATDMFIVKDLRQDTIRKSIIKMIEHGYNKEAFTLIGTIDTVYPNIYKSFDDILDMTI